MHTACVRTKITDVTMTSRYRVKIFYFNAGNPDILKNAPDEHKLVELLPDMDYQWYEIGEALHVSFSVLSGLRISQEANKVKLGEVIHIWQISQASPFTWETVISVIEGRIVNNLAKANDIRDHLNLPRHQ